MQMDRLRLIRLAVFFLSAPLLLAALQYCNAGEVVRAAGERRQEAADSSPSESDSQEEKALVRALRGVTIHPMNGRAPFVGTVLIQGNKIEEVGREVAVPADAIVSEMAGYHVTPGLIESRGKLWLTPAARDEVNTKAALDVQDAIDRWSEDWKELAAQGITTVYVQPADGSFLGGYGAVVKVRPGQEASPVFRPQVAVQAAIGLTGKTSRDRYTQVQNLEKLLKAAQKKLESASDGDNDSQAGEADADAEGDQEGDDDSGDGESDDQADDEESEESESGESEAAEAKDSAEEAMMRLLKKEVPLFASVRHADTLAALLRLSEEYDFRLVLDGLGQINRKSEQLLESGVPFCLGPFHWRAEAGSNGSDDYRWIAEGDLGNRLWTLSGFPAEARSSRYLRMQAALAVQYGVDAEESLKAITYNAARLLGISDQVGSIAKGKLADLVVFAGDPADPSTPVRLVLSEGQVTYEADVEVRAGLVVEAEVTDLPPQFPAHYWLLGENVWRVGKWGAAALEVKAGSIEQVIVGSQVPSEEGVPQYKVGSRPVTMGMVNGMTTLGQANVLKDEGESDRSYVRALDAVDPDSTLGQSFLEQGFVHLNVAAGDAITAPGLAGHLRLGARQYQADPETGAVFVLRASARNRDRYPASINGQVRLIRSLLSGNPMESRLYVGAELADVLLQRKKQVVGALKQKELKALFLADSDLEISNALRLNQSFELDGVLVSRGRLEASLPQVQAGMQGIGVPVLTGAEFQTQVQSYAAAMKAGIPTVFVGDNPTEIRMTAALLASAGVSEATVLSALTEGGGRTIGLESVGLAAGMPADLVIWSGNPLHLASQPDCVIVDGQVVSE